MFLDEFFGNSILQSVFFAYILAGILKILFNYFGTDKVDIKMLFRTGGMPSSHTATVSAMTASIYLLEGVSNLFVVSFIISMVIISDAIGIRRSAGKQAKILNEIIDEYAYSGKFKTKKLYELLGHTPKQVFGGLILGIGVSFLVASF